MTSTIYFTTGPHGYTFYPHTIDLSSNEKSGHANLYRITVHLYDKLCRTEYTLGAIQSAMK